MQTSTADQIRATVREAYGAVASQKQQSGCCGGGTSCCGPTGSSSTRLGYTDADLAAVPDGADLGLGCGNPQAIAGLKPGERVLDLGSGGGACCESVLLGTCCLPQAKSACCGPSPNPTACGCNAGGATKR